LLSGSNTLKETDLYIICSVFVAGTLAWYTLFRMRPSVWVLSAPWVVFGCAFFMIGLPSLYGPFTPPRVIIQRISVWLYAFASSAGFLFFGLNFGDEAGAATEIWVTRACIVQGLQQIWGKSDTAFIESV
jgi:alpha-1,3-glucan synthase